MATKTVNATYRTKSSSSYSSTITSSSSGLVMGAGSSAYYDAISCKFTAPSPLYSSNSVTLTIQMKRGSGSSLVFRYAICKSDANFSRYYANSLNGNAYTDANSIATGTKSISGLSTSWSNKSITFDCTGLQAGTAYYLILYPYSGQFGYYLQATNPVISIDYETSAPITYYTLNITRPSTGFSQAKVSVKKGSASTEVTGTSYSQLQSGDVITVTYSASTGYSVSCTVNGTAASSGGTYTVGSTNVTIVFTATVLSYSLSISQPTGVSITVKRTSSPKQGASTGAILSNGSTIYYSDVLQISYSLSAGYKLGTFTVNGSSFTSGNTHTVTGTVKVVATASVLSYTLSISQGANSTITVNRTSSPKQGASTGTISNGATIYYADVLQISFGVSGDYTLGTHTVNGSTFTSGGSHTVTGNVAVVSTANATSFTLSISAGAGSSVVVLKGVTVLSNGSTINNGDTLSVTFVPDRGYKLTSRKIGATDYGSSAATSTYSVTVTSNLTISAIASILSHPLSNNDKLYVVAIKDANDFKLYAASIYTENGWVVCGK